MEEIMSFLTVLLVAVGIASCIGVMYSSGLRFWAAGTEAQAQGNVNHIVMRIVSVVCFSACVVVVLFALWLMIPIFH